MEPLKLLWPAPLPRTNPISSADCHGAPAVLPAAQQPLLLYKRQTVFYLRKVAVGNLRRFFRRKCAVKIVVYKN